MATLPTATSSMRSSRAPVRDARGPVDERAEVAAGAGDRDVLEDVAAGIHQRHHGAGERLTKRQRGGHREERDRVDADPSGGEVAHDRYGKPGHHRNHRSDPDDMRDFSRADGRRKQAAGQSGDRDGDQRPAQDALDRIGHVSAHVSSS